MATLFSQNKFKHDITPLTNSSVAKTLSALDAYTHVNMNACIDIHYIICLII